MGLSFFCIKVEGDIGVLSIAKRQGVSVLVSGIVCMYIVVMKFGTKKKRGQACKDFDKIKGREGGS
jgi:hypothetical protein